MCLYKCAYASQVPLNAVTFTAAYAITMLNNSNYFEYLIADWLPGCLAAWLPVCFAGWLVVVLVLLL